MIRTRPLDKDRSRLLLLRRRRRRRQQRPWPWISLACLLVLLLAISCTPGCHVVAFSASSSNHKLSTPKNNNNNDQQERQQQDVPTPEGPQRLKIAFVTGNAIKTREMKLLLEEHTKADDIVEYNNQHAVNNDNKNISNKTSNESPPSQSFVELRVVTVDLPEIQEVNTEAIAKEKALLGAQLAGGPCVVEDTSLQFTALGGMPGPYIKWFQDRLGNEGLYNILQAYEDKSAQAVCTLAFCPAPHADPVLFTGVTHGTIVAPIPGREFGWDAIFVPHNNNNSNADGLPFSALTMELKNQSSHRGKAVRQWAAWLRQNRNELWQRQTYGTRSIGHKGLDFKARSVEE